ncbi:F5/8 type C domain protein [Novipirellula artificiosorum]|uniref:F5/8 type C domain protein n=2 Tax=Novipirellula artificiosorum TaxID=2528016 RepID=A0A5C6DZP4_9BACT|nr:F5/8 type C domain protein [Novipirellula artificiosorum]
MVNRRCWIRCCTVSMVVTMTTAVCAKPTNLARLASVSASNEYSEAYLAKFAVDGDVPSKLGADDRGRSWAVRQGDSGGKGWFTLRWDQPQTVAEIIYFGRTSFLMHECWKGYELYLDDESTPSVVGQFEMKHGPQRITLDRPRRLRSVRLEFTSAQRPGNAGAAEIAVFDTLPSDEELVKLFGMQSMDLPRSLPAFLAGLGIDQPNVADLRALIERLRHLHGDRYLLAEQHLAQLERLEKENFTNGDSALGRVLHPNPKLQALVDLQRSVLLFDVEKLLVIRRHEIAASHVYTYHYEAQRNGGGLYLIDPHHPDGRADDASVEVLGTPDGQILDCDLSYDATRVLFSMRRGDRPGYHVYVINVDGSGLVQLTDGPWHDYNACWLPDGGIAFLSSREPQFAYCWHAPVGILHRMEADGSNVVKLSANYLNDFTPYVLNDGRIIYSRWEYVDRPAIPIQSLWTISPDGTGMAGYFGNRVLSPGSFMDARSVPGSQQILCTMTGHNGPTRGAIGLIDNRKGANAQDAIVNLTPDTPIANVDQGNGNTSGSKPYSCPMPLDSDRFLVSARGPLLVRTLNGRCQSTAIAMPDSELQYFFAQPLSPRVRPPIIPPQLRDPALGNAAIIGMQDVYHGLSADVKRGEIKQVRVVREMSKPLRIDPDRRAFGFQFPVISCGATYAGKDVLGDVPIGEDGSALFKVPSGVPLYFIALDAEGRAVQRMRSFTHLMPGERQGCVGCHADRLSASVPQIGMSNLESVPLELYPPEWDTADPDSPGFDYARFVQPIWNEHCIQCHNPIDSEGGLDLTGDQTDFFNVSYEMLAREHQGREGTPYVNWIPTYNGQEWNIREVTPRRWGSYRSRLAEIVRTNHVCTNPGFSNKSTTTTKAKFEMSDRERRRVYAWIDLNVPYYGTSETAYPDAIGCRHIYPEDLDAVLADVGKRRCTPCHDTVAPKYQGPQQQQANVGWHRPMAVPRHSWTRITHPELNDFLLAPLAQSAGGTERCGKAIFKSTADPDYCEILKTFADVNAMLEAHPRLDMPGGRPSAEVNRCSE